MQLFRILAGVFGQASMQSPKSCLSSLAANQFADSRGNLAGAIAPTISAAQSPVDFERVSEGTALETLRQDELEDVAS